MTLAQNSMNELLKARAQQSSGDTPWAYTPSLQTQSGLSESGEVVSPRPQPGSPSVGASAIDEPASPFTKGFWTGFIFTEILPIAIIVAFGTGPLHGGARPEFSWKSVPAIVGGGLLFAALAAPAAAVGLVVGTAASLFSLF